MGLSSKVFILLWQTTPPAGINELSNLVNRLILLLKQIF